MYVKGSNININRLTSNDTKITLVPIYNGKRLSALGRIMHFCQGFSHELCAPSLFYSVFPKKKIASKCCVDIMRIWYTCKMQTTA